VKADLNRIEAIARRWPDDVRLVLLYGPDSGASRDLAGQVARQFADPANPMAVETLAGAMVASDSQALVAAAGAMSMFGDRTLVRVDDLPEDGAEAVAALLAAPPGNPVLITAGALKKGGKLASLAERDPGIVALTSFESSLRDAPRMVADLAAPFGLRVSREAAVALFEATGGDRGLLRREVEKLATFLDSAADQPKSADLGEVGAIVVGAGDGDQYALVAAVTGGRPSEASALLERGTGVPGIVLLRAIERRLTLLLGLRGAVDGGASPRSVVDSARPPIFWKEKDAIVVELGLWPMPALQKGLADILAAECAIKASGSLGETLAAAAVLLLARRAASRR
jgi:DNA polymerase-3 subunit delta